MKFHDANGNTKKVVCLRLILKVPRDHFSDVGCWMSHGPDKIPHINTWKFKTILSARCKLKLDQELNWSRHDLLQ